jgi:hypothetical protein
MDSWRSSLFSVLDEEEREKVLGLDGSDLAKSGIRRQRGSAGRDGVGRVEIGSRKSNDVSLKEKAMLLTIALILFVLWALGFFAFHVAGGFIHLLLIVAVIVIVVHLIQGRRV